MKTVNIHEAKTHLSRLIKEVLEGDEVVISRANQPLVKLVLLESARPARMMCAFLRTLTRFPSIFGRAVSLPRMA